MSNSFHHCQDAEVATMSFARWTGREKGAGHSHNLNFAVFFIQL